MDRRSPSTVSGRICYLVDSIERALVVCGLPEYIGCTRDKLDIGDINTRIIHVLCIRRGRRWWMKVLVSRGMRIVIWVNIPSEISRFCVRIVDVVVVRACKAFLEHKFCIVAIKSGSGRRTHRTAGTPSRYSPLGRLSYHTSQSASFSVSGYRIDSGLCDPIEERRDIIDSGNAILCGCITI